MSTWESRKFKHTMPARLDSFPCLVHKCFCFFESLNFKVKPKYRLYLSYVTIALHAVNKQRFEWKYVLFLTLSLALTPSAAVAMTLNVPKKPNTNDKAIEQRGEVIKSVKNESNVWSYNQKRKKITAN